MEEQEIKVISGLPQEKQDFIAKQLEIYKGQGFMDGNMFMPFDGKCYNCNQDVLSWEMGNGNDGSKAVTGCHYCHRSYCD